MVARLFLTALLALAAATPALAHHRPWHKPSTPPVDTSTWQSPMTASAWVPLYGVSVLRPVQAGAYVAFTIPRCDGDAAICQHGPQIDYVQVAAPAPLVGISITFTAELILSPGASIRQADDGWGCPSAYMSLLIRRGTDLTYATNRWWAINVFEMKPGLQTVTVPLGPANLDGTASWKSIIDETSLTHTAQFEDTKKNLTALGFTFGGCYAGHGIQVTGGTAQFILREYRINR